MRDAALQIFTSVANLLTLLAIYTACSALTGFILGLVILGDSTATDTAVLAGFCGIVAGLTAAVWEGD